MEPHTQAHGTFECMFELGWLCFSTLRLFEFRARVHNIRAHRKEVDKSRKDVISTKRSMKRLFYYIPFISSMDLGVRYLVAYCAAWTHAQNKWCVQSIRSILWVRWVRGQLPLVTKTSDDCFESWIVCCCYSLFTVHGSRCERSNKKKVIQCAKIHICRPLHPSVRSIDTHHR